MMRKSSKSTYFDFRRPRPVKPVLAAWLAVLLIGSGATAVFAQNPSTPVPSARPTPTPKLKAYVRFWNMLIGPKPPDLQLMTTEAQPLTSGAAGNAFAGYLAVDPGTYTFTVRRANDPNGIIKRLPVALRGDVYITLLAAADKSGKPDVQLIDDTANPATDDGLGKLVVRQFFPGASVTAGVNTKPPGTPLAFGDSATMEGLPLRGTIVTMSATGLGPTTKTWTVEADFATGGHHATMLVVPDPYGRFRPQLVFDGSARKPIPPPAPPSGSSSGAASHP